MTRSLVALALAAALCGCGATGAGPAPRAAEPRLGLARQPDWLTPYHPEQRALLRIRPDSPETSRARAVYPLLDRFVFVEDEPFSPWRARLAARLVWRHAEDSPLLYVLGTVESRLANDSAQYGPEPPDEPDPWVRTVRQDRGYRLEWARPGAAARRELDAANRAIEKGDAAAAARALRRATERSPRVPGLWTALARALAAAGDEARAERALRNALSIDPRCFAAHLQLAELLAARGARARARRAVARALALYPYSLRALHVADQLAHLASRPRPPAVFIEVADSGAIVVGTTGGPATRTYAVCRAGIRYEPELRAQVLRIPSGAPYQLSAGEELFCLEAMLGELLSRRGEAEPDQERLLEIAQQGWLAEYVMFDVIGQQRPEWLRLAPDPQLDSVVRYVRAVVLGAG